MNIDDKEKKFPLPIEDENLMDEEAPLSFLDEVEADEIDQDDELDEQSAYNFRAQYREKIASVPTETEQVDHSFSSLRFHAIGIGILIGILTTVLASVLLWGLSDEKEIEPIVIVASNEAIKEAPLNPGGMNIPDQDKLVYKRLRTDDLDTQVENIVPVPEAPVKPVSSVPEQEIQTPEPVPPPTPTVQPIVKSEAKAKESPAPSKAAALDKEMWHVQLISLPSRAMAEKNWIPISKEHSALLKGLPHDIIAADIPGKGTFYRLRVGEFKTREDAKALCDKLKARKQDCTVTK